MDYLYRKTNSIIIDKTKQSNKGSENYNETNEMKPGSPEGLSSV